MARARSPSLTKMNNNARNFLESQPLMDSPFHYTSINEVFHSDKIPAFKTFRLQQGGCTQIAIYFTIFQTLTTLISFHNVFCSYDHDPTVLQSAVLLRFVVLFLSWSYIYYSSKYSFSRSTIDEEKRIFFLGNAIVVTQAIVGAIKLLSVVVDSDYVKNDYLYGNPNPGIPMSILFIVISGNIAIPVFFTCHDTFICLISAIITYGTMFITGLLLQLPIVELLGTVTIGVIIFFTLASYERTIFSTFLMFSNFEVTLRDKLASESKEDILKNQTEEMRHMIGNVAHDLRTPLQAFMSEVQVLHYNIKKDCEDRSGVLEMSIIQLDRICEFMTMTINRSIDFTKASSGLKLNPSIESVNFPETLSWAVGCMDKSNETVPIIIMPVPLNIRNQIFTDKQWLMENMFCLLSNAQKFTTEGEITIRCALQSIPNSRSENENLSNDKASSSLSVSTEFLTTMLLIEVEDSGIGISKENRERLFKPFVQAQRRTGGTGLGLYALSKRMESIGGHCGVRQRSDGASGSCFWVSVPYKPDETIMSPRQRPSSGKFSHRSCNQFSDGEMLGTRRRHDSGVSIESMLSGYIYHKESLESGDRIDEESTVVLPYHPLRILLVDDSSLIRKTTAKLLANEGHDVVVAQHGADCLKILDKSNSAVDGLAETPFDLILMDLQMPVMDGLEATRRIRARENMMEKNKDSISTSMRHHRILIVGLSANTVGDVREDCLAMGMNEFFEKPLKLKNLQEYLEKTLLHKAENL